MYSTNINSAVRTYSKNMENNRVMLWTTEFLCANHRNNLHNLNEACKYQFVTSDRKRPYSLSSETFRPPKISEPPDFADLSHLSKFSDNPHLQNILKFPSYITSQTFQNHQPLKVSEVHSLANLLLFRSSDSTEDAENPNPFIIPNI
jgi:hypothetical protein